MPIRKIKNPYNFEKCRICQHGYISHTEFDNLVPSSCHNLVDKLHRYKPCTCMEFLPKDNLAYLEYLYDKQLGKSIS